MSGSSLKCTQCNTLLASVKEAQAHNEITGHTSFEETTEVLRLWRCLGCGKLARSDADKTLHTRFTQHAEWQEVCALFITASCHCQRILQANCMQVGNATMQLACRPRPTLPRPSTSKHK
jgi:hypothetical protein